MYIHMDVRIMHRIHTGGSPEVNWNEFVSDAYIYICIYIYICMHQIMLMATFFVCLTAAMFETLRGFGALKHLYKP